MNVTLRPLKLEDAYSSFRWRNDSEVFKYTGKTFPDGVSLEMELAWMSSVLSNPDQYRCAIEADGKYVGNIYLLNISSGVGEYSIFIGEKAYWGKGVAKNASKQIIDYGFSTLQLNKIILFVQKQNTRAFALYHSLGFVEVSEKEGWVEMVINNPYQSY